jgi:hypothetical protein
MAAIDIDLYADITEDHVDEERESFEEVRCAPASV